MESGDISQFAHEFGILINRMVDGIRCIVYY